jgi:hypothetical protein
MIAPKTVEFKILVKKASTNLTPIFEVSFSLKNIPQL